MVKLASWLAAANLAQLGLGVLRMTVLTRWLGVEAYGELGYVLAVVTMADTLAQAGLGVVLTRDVAAHPNRDGALFGAVLGVRTVLSVAAGFAAWTVGGPWAFLMVVAQAGQMGVAVLRAKLLRGTQILATSLPVVLGLAAVSALWAGGAEPTMRNALSALSASLAVAAAGQLALAARRLKRPPEYSGRTAASMLRGSWPFWVVGILAVALSRLDVVMLQVMLGPERGAEANGYYRVAYQLVENGAFLLGAIVTVAFPAMSSRAGNRAELGRVYRRSLKGALLAGSAAFVGVVLLGRWAIVTVAGPRFAPAAGALYALSPGLVLVLVNTLAASLLTALHRPFAILAACAVALAVNVGLNLWAIPRWGFVGAAAATTAAEFTVLACYARLTLRYVRP